MSDDDRYLATEMTDEYLAMEAAEERVAELKKRMRRTARHLRFWAREACDGAPRDTLAEAFKVNAADLEITAEGGAE